MSNFYQLFRECAERWPGNIALEIQHGDSLESYTYSQLRQSAESIGSWLMQNGFHPGGRAAILADNHPRWVMAYFGIIVAGGIAVPLDTALSPAQIAKLIKDSGSTYLFVGSKYLQSAANVLSGFPIKLVQTDIPQKKMTDGSAVASTLDAIFRTSADEFSPPPLSSDDLASLLYTSGTTSDPKGVMLTHGNLMGEVDAVFSCFNLGPEDALLGVLPLFHVLSQMANLLLPMVKGSRVVYLETLNTTELLRALAERNITAFAVVPQFFYLIHDRIFKEVEKRGRVAKSLLRFLMAVTRFCRRFGMNPGPIFFAKIHRLFGPKMRYLVTGGSRFDPQIARDFQALGIDVLQAYGLTETAGGAFANPPGDVEISSVGKAFSGVNARIVNPQLQDAGGQPVGEIAIRGPIVMKGYWNRPDATAAAIQDDWLFTGDLGYFDAQRNLFITGRRKEVIVLSNGKNIYPEEVEAHYLQSPFIKEICVLGLEGSPSDPNADKLHAVVIPNFDALKQKKIVNAKEVLRYDIENLSAKLPSTKRIGSYEIWQDELPRTTTRKLKRFEIEKRVRASQAKGSSADIGTAKPLTDEDQQWLAQADVQRAIAIVRNASKAKRDGISPGDNLELDLGLDSMQRIELLVALEQQLGGDVEESQLSEIYSVKELVTAVLESSAQGGGRQIQHIGWKSIFVEESTDPEVLALTKPRPVSESFLFILSRLVQIISLDRFRMKVSGLEKLPREGAFILSSNHQAYLDPLIMTSFLPWPIFTNLFSVGTSDIFGAGFMRHVARILRVVVVDPDANLVPAMRAGAFGLRHGRVLILYPEGERSIEGPPKTFKKGAAILSIHMQVPIIPVAIDGFEKVWPRGKSFQGFFPLKMTIGDPIFPPPESEASEAAYEQLTTELKSRVMEMWEVLRETAH